MKHLKIYVMALLSLIASPGLLHAQAMVNGKVQAMIVQGDVQLVAKDGTTSPLTRGQIFEEGSLVKAGPSGLALLVFSNGATLKLLNNCQLSVDQFQQAPFDEQAEGTFLRLSKDPSKSTTKLDLRNGTLQGEVKQLNQAAGSTFTVNTPGGSAGIRGTVLSISVVRNAAGVITSITCTCVVGNVGFAPPSGVTVGGTGAAGTTTTNNTAANADVSGGGILAVTLTVNPDGTISGGSIAGSAMSTATGQSLADALADTVNTARTAAGLAPAPAATVTVSTPPTVTTTNGVTTTTSTSVTLAPVATTDASGTTTYTSSPAATVTTTSNTGTTTTSTSTPVNTNPSTVSTF